MPKSLDERYGLILRELGAGSLNRLLLLHSVMSSSLRVSAPGGSGQCSLSPPVCPSPVRGLTLRWEEDAREPPPPPPRTRCWGQRRWAG